MGVQNLQANVDSKLVANQVNGIYIAKESSMTRQTILREIYEGSCSMHAGPRFLVEKALRSVIPSEIGMPTLKTTEVDTVKNNEALGIILDLLEEKREQAAIQEARSKAKMKGYYNARVQSTSFRPGDFV
nr:reverse transcriptase domain-containing protein [Tanacetum cinerariifolium]